MSDPDSLSVQGDDPEINAAIAEAQRRLPEFRRIIADDSRRIIPMYAGAFVKVCVENEITRGFEHIWLEGVYFDGQNVGGWVLTSPHDISLTKGEELTLPVSRITDWMYYEGETLHGAFVENILMRRSKHAP
jgi:uncharacterized protein YegJ (DUF2314 family)